MVEKIEEKIIKDILTTGFPLEMEVANNFSRDRWIIDHNSYYIDKDELKGREIDLVATLFLNNPEYVTKDGYFELHYIMPIEIKLANKKPWVFFNTEASNFERFMGIPLIKKEIGFRNEHYKYYDIIMENVTQLELRIGRSFYEAFSGTGSRDDIYKALTGTIKALEHLVEAFPYDDFQDNKEYSNRYLFIYEPIIVVKGSMFTANFNGEQINVQEADYIQVSFKYLSPNYDRQNYMVNVVRSDKLAEFISNKEEKMRKLYKELCDLEGISLEEVDIA
ncbi:hypothetical protein J2T12_000999 [Paenibacillus anaericanus]|uniref:hypothetical protein n=1 Tax=Paenibacillus anaericanus TaxID=170367 RepID=UPI0027875E7D|nr:hypothetical protein [Paenibacillus anaericanus]MDQ0087605.1 hypothetical protein [Paenibacillus anaericanus]